MQIQINSSFNNNFTRQYTTSGGAQVSEKDFAFIAYHEGQGDNRRT